MDSPLTLFDVLVIFAYFGLLVFLTFKYGRSDSNEEQFLLSGRKITLPAMVATLVSTWYGGILGVGEYGYQFGISQWLLFGFPFYVFALLFGIFLSSKIREHPAFSIPEAIGSTYNSRTGRLASIPVFVLVSPAPYILMLGLLFQFLLGSGDGSQISNAVGLGPTLWYALAVAAVSVIYVSIGGFGAVVRTDIIQVILMFAGFAILILFAMNAFGGPDVLWDALPARHKDITGGHTLQYILVWFFIAMWTFVDPGFHQRAAAAKSSQIARKGIFVSILFWAVFDILTLTSALYGRAILGDSLNEPILTYPILAYEVLPSGLQGLFFVTLLATIMSTLDSFVFLSGQTLGRDLLKPLFPHHKPNTLTRWGITASALLAVILILIYPSVIDLWYIIGSVMIPGILIPVLGVYLSPFRLAPPYPFITLIAGTGTSLIWLALGTWYNPTAYSYAFLGVEPFYPGLFVSIIIWAVGKTSQQKRL